jgi:hypothetical protein
MGVRMNKLSGKLLIMENKKYLFILGKEINKRNFYITSTIEEPIEYFLMEVFRDNNDGTVMAGLYEGEDYAEILEKFMND